MSDYAITQISVIVSMLLTHKWIYAYRCVQLLPKKTTAVPTVTLTRRNCTSLIDHIVLVLFRVSTGCEYSDIY